MDIQYSSCVSDLLDFLWSEINRLTDLISVGSIVNHSISFLLKKLTISRIKFSRKRLELKFYKIYRKEEALYQLKNSKK